MTTPDNYTAHYSLCTEREPGALLRVLQLFALNSLVPCHVLARQSGADTQVIDIRCRGLSEQRAELIRGKLASLVVVERVSLEHVWPISARRAA